MMPFLRFMCAVAVSLSFVASPTVAHSDPIVISSGSAVGNAAATVKQLIMNVQGPEFSFLTSGGPIGGFLPNIGECTPCGKFQDGVFVASGVVDLGATLETQKLGFIPGSGTGVVEGVTYPHVWVGFESGTITTPTVTLSELGESFVDVPFSFNTLMHGYLGDLVQGNLERVFTVELTGSGRASASFIGLVDDEHGQTFSIGSLMRYDFVQPQPVPEPGTLFLVGGAIGALAARRSLRNRRQQRTTAGTGRKH
jgi:PEP-CTERM motif